MKKQKPNYARLLAFAVRCGQRRRERIAAAGYAEEGCEVPNRSDYEKDLETYVWELERAVEGLKGKGLVELATEQDPDAAARAAKWGN